MFLFQTLLKKIKKMDKINILDSLIVSLAFLVLTLKFYKITNKVKFILYFISLLIVNILFCLFFSPNNEKNSFICQYLMALITFVYVYNKNYKLYSIYTTIKVLFYFYIIIMFFGSILFLLFMNINIKLNVTYNIFMSFLIMLSCYIIKKFNFKAEISYSNKILLTEIAFNILVIIFISIIMPYLPIFKDIYSYNIITLFSSLVFIFTYFVFNYLYKLHIENVRNNLNAEYLIKKEEYIKEQQEKYIVYRHFIKQLISSILIYIENKDIAGLTGFYEKYLYPINKDIVQSENSKKLLAMVKHELLHNFLFSTINQISILNDIKLSVNIDSIINSINLDNISLLKICSIYVQNAIEEVQNQKDGFIIINIKIDIKTNTFIFIVENSIIDGQSVDKPNNFHKGFEIIKEIAAKNPNINIHTYKKINEYIQMLEVFNEKYK